MDRRGMEVLSLREGLIAKVYKVSAVGEQLWHEVAHELTDVNSAAFAFGVPTPLEEVKQRMSSVDALALVYDSEVPVGFASYQTAMCCRRLVVYQSRGLAAGYRGRGLGRLLTCYGVSRYRPYVLAAHAQNPISILATMRSGILETVYPIEASYDADDEMFSILADLVNVRGYSGQVCLDTGLHKGAYPMGKLGDYPVDMSHPGIAMVERRLAEIGLDRERGDAVYYMGRAHVLPPP